MPPTVVHLMGYLMDRKLDAAAGHLLQRSLEGRGIAGRCKGATKAILGTCRAGAVPLDCGTVIDTDLVVMAVGIRPGTRLAADAGLTVGCGITVDAGPRTDDPAIFAPGREDIVLRGPALNDYLLADWPLDCRVDPRSRFVNEPNDASIRKDGTYSVVPRPWGGVTTPAELRAIADAADRYAVPMVKVTGGQRIDLLGVRTEDLPAIWADPNAAGMVPGHACAKGPRTVKTCVGTEFCRFGTQNPTALGIWLE